MITFDLIIEFIFSLFDALVCVSFITKFNHASLSPKKNKFIIPAILILFSFSVINDLFLSGFNVVGTTIFLILYIAYSLLIANKKYIRALLSACIFEIVFVLLSSLLYFVITLIIKDYEQLAHGSNTMIRYMYVTMHKIALYVILKIILMAFKSDSSIDRKQGILAFIFSFITILGLGSTMYISAVVEAEKIQVPMLIITLCIIFSNIALYSLIYQMQRFQENKYELKLLQEKIAFEESRHNDATLIWSNIRKVQHDMKHHLSIIGGYLNDNKPDECNNYIKELMPKIKNIGNLITSDNTILDYLINSKLTPLENTQIIISGSIGDLSDINDLDFVCLMGNILENAAEAIQKIKNPKERRIELLFFRQNSNRIIICKNTIEKSVLKNNKELKTTKKGRFSHGYGTKIIAKIVSDYNGMVDYFEEFNMFGVQVVLPEPD